MSFADALTLTRSMTVARMLERDDFEKRYKANQPISMVEFMYPLIQGYDSIVLGSDLEIGGSDQLFNMLVGRNLQKERGSSPQAVLTLPLLVGLDGSRKMSKSYDNYISFNDTPTDIFGKTMSISDEVMWDYYRLLLLKTPPEIESLKQQHPMDCKKQLSRELTSLFYGNKQGLKELEAFSQVFSRGENPDEMREVSVASLDLDAPTILNFLSEIDLFESKGQVRRLISQGAVKLDGEKVGNPELNLQKICDRPLVLRAGKKTFLRIVP